MITNRLPLVAVLTAFSRCFSGVRLWIGTGSQVCTTAVGVRGDGNEVATARLARAHLPTAASDELRQVSLCDSLSGGPRIARLQPLYRRHRRSRVSTSHRILLTQAARLGFLSTELSLLGFE